MNDEAISCSRPASIWPARLLDTHVPSQRNDSSEEYRDYLPVTAFQQVLQHHHWRIRQATSIASPSKCEKPHGRVAYATVRRPVCSLVCIPYRTNRSRRVSALSMVWTIPARRAWREVGLICSKSICLGSPRAQPKRIFGGMYIPGVSLLQYRPCKGIGFDLHRLSPESFLEGRIPHRTMSPQ